MPDKGQRFLNSSQQSSAVRNNTAPPLCHQSNRYLPLDHGRARMMADDIGFVGTGHASGLTGGLIDRGGYGLASLI